MKRGEERFKQMGRFAFQLRRSSDGKWEQNGKPLGFFHLIPFHRGEGEHRDKWCACLVIGEFALYVAGCIGK